MTVCRQSIGRLIDAAAASHCSINEEEEPGIITAIAEDMRCDIAEIPGR